MRTYTGDDPLDSWIRYIQWTEQNFPQGGKDSHLGVLMQKCLIQFKNDDLYKQDIRYVSIWLKMVLKLFGRKKHFKGILISLC